MSKTIQQFVTALGGPPVVPLQEAPIEVTANFIAEAGKSYHVIGGSITAFIDAFSAQVGQVWTFKVLTGTLTLQSVTYSAGSTVTVRRGSEPGQPWETSAQYGGATPAAARAAIEAAKVDLSDAQALTRLARQRVPRRVALLGDSISDMNGGPVHDGVVENYSPQGYFNWANVLLGQRFEIVVNAGVSGGKVSQMANRFAADIAAYTPDIVIVFGGINDLYEITGAGNRQTIIDRIKTDLSAVYALVANLGALCVVSPITPVAASFDSPLSADQLIAWSQVNEWIRIQAQTRAGVILADMSAALTDPSTTGKPSGDGGTPFLLNDGLHPAATGAYLMGRALAAALSALLPVGNEMHHGIGDANKLTNPVFTGATGSTPPTGWIMGDLGGGTINFTYEARTDAVAGNWLVAAITGGAHYKIERSVTGFSTGDRVKFIFEYEVTSAAGAVNRAIASTIETRLANATRIELLGALADASFTSGGIARHVTVGVPYVHSGVIETPPIVWTADTGFIQVVLWFRGEMTVKIGRACVVKIN